MLKDLDVGVLKWNDVAIECLDMNDVSGCTRAKEPASLIDAMKKRFPSAELFLAIECGAAANVKP